MVLWMLSANKAYVNLFLLTNPFFFFFSVIWVEMHTVLSQVAHTHILPFIAKLQRRDMFQLTQPKHYILQK